MYNLVTRRRAANARRRSYTLTRYIRIIYALPYVYTMNTSAILNLKQITQTRPDGSVGSTRDVLRERVHRVARQIFNTLHYIYYNILTRSQLHHYKYTAVRIRARGRSGSLIPVLALLGIGRQTLPTTLQDDVIKRLNSACSATAGARAGRRPGRRTPADAFYSSFHKTNQLISIHTMS